MKSMTFTAAGDAIFLKRTAPYEGYDEICDFINKAEAKIINLETVLSEYDSFPNATSGGTWMNADPKVADDITAMGFNFFGVANNHAMDFSYGGLESTCRALKERGIAYSGTGCNLYEASRPAVLDFSTARVGVISVCSSFDQNWKAGEQGPALKGRPGLNYLRFNTEYIVTAAQLESLKEIAAATNINIEADIERRDGFLPPLEEGTFVLGKQKYRVGENTGCITTCNKKDKKRLLDLITDSRRYLDYVVVMVHSHEMGTSHTDPAMFYKEFAHDAIDAGACAIIGGGCHQLRPVEIYNGKPIFYSLGNFVFQTNAVRLLPYDFTDKLGFPKDVTTAEALALRSDNGKRGLHSKIDNFLTVIPYIKMQDDEVTEIVLKPVELGFDRPIADNGLPHPAKGDTAKDIFNRLDRLSAPYGTKLTLDGDLIRISLT
ncbi:MAG: CapA family protein [Ruminococcaceae bacterium]|nr:CapA family protein [Oscillospiraceae bacterium]